MSMLFPLLIFFNSISQVGLGDGSSFLAANGKIKGSVLDLNPEGGGC